MFPNPFTELLDPSVVSLVMCISVVADPGGDPHPGNFFLDFIGIFGKLAKIRSSPHNTRNPISAP